MSKIAKESKVKAEDRVAITLWDETHAVDLPVTASRLMAEWPDYLFITDLDDSIRVLNPKNKEWYRVSPTGKATYLMTTTDDVTSDVLSSYTGTDMGSLSSTPLSTTTSTSSAFDSSLWTTSSSPFTVGTSPVTDWGKVYPSYPSGGYATSGYVDVSPSYYAEDMMPHLVRAKEEGTRQKIEMDTVVLDRGVAKSCGLDHADMILGLKVKYAKPGSLPMDSAFVLLKDEKAAASDKEKIRALEKEIAELEKRLDAKAKACYELEEDLKKARRDITGLRGIAIKRGEMLAGEDSDAEADHVRPAPVLRPVTLEMMKPRKELDGKSCEVTLDGRKVNIVLIDVIDISQNYSADGWESMEVTLFDGWSTDKILIQDRRDAEALLSAVLA